MWGLLKEDEASKLRCDKIGVVGSPLLTLGWCGGVFWRPTWTGRLSLGSCSLGLDHGLPKYKVDEAHIWSVSCFLVDVSNSLLEEGARIFPGSWDLVGGLSLRCVVGVWALDGDPFIVHWWFPFLWVYIFYGDLLPLSLCADGASSWRMASVSHEGLSSGRWWWICTGWLGCIVLDLVPLIIFLRFFIILLGWLFGGVGP